MSIKAIVGLVCMCISLIVNLITFILERKKAGKVVGLTGMLELIETIVPTAMEYAENAGLNSGELKKLIALNKVKEYCSQRDIKADDTIVSNLIESLIVFSKTVNSNKSKTEVTKSVGVGETVEGDKKGTEYKFTLRQ